MLYNRGTLSVWKGKPDKETPPGDRVLPSQSLLCFCQHTSTFPKDQSDYITLQREEDEHKRVGGGGGDGGGCLEAAVRQSGEFRATNKTREGHRQLKEAQT